MDYALARELKDAGFEQKGWGAYLLPGGMEVGPNANASYVPTLSELIEACGPEFLYLIRDGDGRWRCWGRNHQNGFAYDTPEEAVARLWLALNRKA